MRCTVSGSAGVRQTHRRPSRPAAVIGVLGGGQLGGCSGSRPARWATGSIALDPDPDCPTAAVADEIVVGRYDDVDAALRLAAMSDVVTYELEHVGLEAATAAGELAPLRPGLTALRATQDRLAERRFIRDDRRTRRPVARGPRTPRRPRRPPRPWATRSGSSCPWAATTAARQVRIASRREVAAALASLGGADGRPLLLEREIDFEAELSVVCARDRRAGRWPSRSRATSTTPGSWSRPCAPAPIDPIDRQRRPRGRGQHRARRWTWSGCSPWSCSSCVTAGWWSTSWRRASTTAATGRSRVRPRRQFEQHVRAICGLPLGSVAPHGVAAMVNLLGTGPDRDARLSGHRGRPRRPGASTSTSTTSAGCSSGARWAT